MPAPNKPRISFLAYFVLWAERMRWEVPALHVRACVWLEEWWFSEAREGLFMLPRGHAKSTVLGVFNAWLYGEDPSLRILHQGESDSTAYKTARDTKAILRKHQLTTAISEALRGEVSFWWLAGNQDERNPSMQAAGVTSNITSSRADFIQNDDVEVQKNIRTPEARELLRHRLSEQVHILVPGGKTLWVGTPHTHDSIYEEVKARGAMSMIVRMFQQEQRIERASGTRYAVNFPPEYVFVGIGKGAELLTEGVHYTLSDGWITFAAAPCALVDLYAGAAWPERFTRAEMADRRSKCRTLNEWDSQYQLHAKPMHQVRLDPARIIPYDIDPIIKQANDSASMWLGRTQIVGAASRWDPASNKPNSDVSAFAVLLQDQSGKRYLQAAVALPGEVAEFAEDGKTITGGQVWTICDHVERYSLPRVTVETNGIGTFAPAVLRAALTQRKLVCAVVESDSTKNKNERILDAWEPLLLSRGTLWAHIEVLKGSLWNQMRDWNPAVKQQPDDYLDVVAGTIAETPERIRAKAKTFAQPDGYAWRNFAGVVEVPFER